ncbi:MAG: SGNH/GDSL hydrolase family protein [Verrucomicrobia bacterium]|nr:SGNH/GDSL hydrolase family protein [Verrucomicrobiota bacterium]
MKILARFTFCLMLHGAVTVGAQPIFTSLHVFGDSVSATISNPNGGSLFYGKRYCNGRVWVEDLAGWRGLSFDITNYNHSYWEHYGNVLLGEMSGYTAPVDAGTALFVVWVNNADMFRNITDTPGLAFDDSDLAFWTSANNQSLTNHYRVITNLYSKGVRTLLMPNAADLAQTPEFANHYSLNEAQLAWIGQRTVEYNNGFRLMISNAALSLPNLTIYSPDIFTLFTNVLSNPASFGMTNPGVGATEDGYSDLNGPGADYVYWDFIHPTAKFQRLFAEEARKLIWPTKLTGISQLNGTNLLSTMNVQIGRVQDGDGLATGRWNTAPTL